MTDQERRAGPVGRVVGTEDSTPLHFWVALGPDRYLQLDDVVICERPLPDGESVTLSGIVTQVIARQEGAQFASDVFLIADGVLPGEVVEVAEVTVSRVEPEIYVPPQPGAESRRAEHAERDHALFFDEMEHRVPIGLGRDGAPLYANLEFLDGTRGAHVNISGISGVATKTSYATFLLYSLFHSGVLGGGEEARLRAILAASTLVGTAMLRYIIQVPPLATLSADEVVKLIAPTVTRYLTAAAEELGLPDL